MGDGSVLSTKRHCNSHSIFLTKSFEYVLPVCDVYFFTKNVKLRMSHTNCNFYETKVAMYNLFIKTQFKLCSRKVAELLISRKDAGGHTLN